MLTVCSFKIQDAAGLKVNVEAPVMMMMLTVVVLCLHAYRTSQWSGRVGEASTSVKTSSCCCFSMVSCSTCRVLLPMLSWDGFPQLPSGRRQTQNLFFDHVLHVWLLMSALITCVLTGLYQLQVLVFWCSWCWRYLYTLLATLLGTPDRIWSLLSPIKYRVLGKIYQDAGNGPCLWDNNMLCTHAANPQFIILKGNYANFTHQSKLFVVRLHCG